MKAPKNFYNTVDQTKLGIDDLYRRTAENEADIVALENAMADIESKEALKSVKYFRVVINRNSNDSFHVNGFRLHSSSMNKDFTFPGGSTVSASVTIPNINFLIQNITREVGVWHVENLYPFNIDFYVPTGVDLTVYNEVQFLGGYYENTFPQSSKLLISDDGTTYKEVASNDSITYPGADNRVDFFGFDTDPVIEDIYDRIDDLETVVGDDTSGLVKSVSDLETVVGDSTSGLVKDVNDIESHLYYDVNATSLTSPAGTLTFSKPVNEVITDIRNSGKVPRLCVSVGTNEIEYAYILKSVSTGFVFAFTCIAGSNDDVYYNQFGLYSNNTTTTVTSTQKKLT